MGAVVKRAAGLRDNDIDTDDEQETGRKRSGPEGRDTAPHAGGAGSLKGGRHLSYPGNPSMANLLVTLMRKFDVPVERVGGSTGELPLDTLAEV
jgi:hypothetical protein